MIYSLGVQQIYKDGRLIDAEGYEYDGKRLKVTRHDRGHPVTTRDVENILSHPSKQSLLARLHECRHALNSAHGQRRRHTRHRRRRVARRRHRGTRRRSRRPASH
jgi:hypothetical protein